MLKKGTVLVVDDNRINLEVLHDLLESYGIAVLLANSIQEAKSRFEIGGHCIKLLISDWNLDKETGGELIDWVGKEFPEVLSCIYSGGERREINGVDWYEKPTQLQELIKLAIATLEPF